MTSLQKIAAGLLIGIYFLSGSVTRELLKLPVLATHYYKYQSEDKNNNLLSFLINHYIKEDGTDSDAAEDRKLPFKSPENLVTGSVISLPPAMIIHPFEKPVIQNKSRFFIRTEIFISSAYLAAIWQPPRNC